MENKEKAAYICKKACTMCATRKGKKYRRRNGGAEVQKNKKPHKYLQAKI